jgi:hypothetical protein
VLNAHVSGNIPVCGAFGSVVDRAQQPHLKINRLLMRGEMALPCEITQELDSSRVTDKP